MAIVKQTLAANPKATPKQLLKAVLPEKPYTNRLWLKRQQIYQMCRVRLEGRRSEEGEDGWSCWLHGRGVSSWQALSCMRRIQ